MNLDGNAGNPAAFSATPAVCTLTLTETFSSSPDITSDASFSSGVNNGNQVITVGPINDSLDLVGTISGNSIRADVTGLYDTSTVVKTDTSTFDIEILNHCLDGTIVTITMPDPLTYEHIVLDDPSTFTIPDATINGDTSVGALCGTPVLSLTSGAAGSEVNVPETASDPLQFVPSTRVLTVDTTNTSLIGTNIPITLTATLSNFPSTGVSNTNTGTVSFNDPCDDPFDFQATGQTNPSNVSYGGSAVAFTLTSFTIDPAFCPVTYSITDVTNSAVPGNVLPPTKYVDTLNDDGQVTITLDDADYSGDVVRPGVYTFTITATESDPDNISPESLTATFDVTVVDICYPPTSLAFSAGTAVDQTYKITDDDSYQIPAAIITPSFCKFDYSSQIDPTPTSNINGVTEDLVTDPTGRTFKFEYDTDLTPVGESQLVTITVTSKSDYSAIAPSVTTPNVITATDDFTVTYESPCDDDMLTQLTVVPMQGTVTDGYSNSNSFTLFTTGKENTIVPDFCALTVTCKSIAVQSGTYANANNLACSSYEPTGDVVTLNFDETSDYVNGNVPPGTYRFTYTVSSAAGVAALNKDVYFDLTLTDPCETATISVNPQASYADFMLTITQATDTYDLGAGFTTTPSYCNTEITTVDDDTTDILETKYTTDSSTGVVTFNQFSDSLDIIGGVSGGDTTITVTATYKVGSIYDTGSFPVTEDRTFNVVVKNPCTDG